MTWEKGNNYYQFRDKHGRDHKYTSEGIWNEFVEYCEWMNNNPLKEAVVIQKQASTIKVKKMRAMTIGSFCLFASITTNTFGNYRKDPDFSPIITHIQGCIYTQKFEGAAAGLLNSSIISKELGLTTNLVVEDKRKTVEELFPTEEELKDEE